MDDALLVAEVTMAEDNGRGLERLAFIIGEKESGIDQMFDPNCGQGVGLNHDVLGNGGPVCKSCCLK